ncbi:hypothetical protein D4L85_21080 [Chryseolinea soli]|uniref:Uncharacterized protein n=1 Tax=Chryseolinea soli TaxID=2321403 RepID=A0A385SVV0_9BACT|nr:hypothetical protein D4L85_21080 [Chryseolinea soli]
MRPRPDDYRSAAPFETAMKLLGMTMAVVYVALGVAVAWRADKMFNIPPSYTLLLGSIMIAYGLFRGYGVYRKYFKH